MGKGRISLEGRRVLEILRSTVKVEPSGFVVIVAEPMGPFATLVGIILSQNTNDKNAIAALKNLAETIGLNPEVLASKNIDEIANIIRVAGLQIQKARTIIILSRKLLEKGGEKYLVEAPVDELRRWLLSIPGIGQKTVDVFLASVRRVPVFAVDTHAFRIAKRWGLVNSKSYKETSKALLEFFGPENALEAHRLLIEFGRAYCKARNPRCGSCPLASYCPSALRQ